MTLLDRLLGPRLHITRAQWDQLCATLHRKTGEVHESGAFLLGTVRGRRRTISEIVYYDDLAPDAYCTGVVRLEASAFTALWAICRARDLVVVADIHVHPDAAFQSIADRDNPMIATRGHLALILPRFARGPIVPADIGLFEYRGAHRWHVRGGRALRRHLKIRRSQ